MQKRKNYSFKVITINFEPNYCKCYLGGENPLLKNNKISTSPFCNPNKIVCKMLLNSQNEKN